MSEVIDGLMQAHEVLGEANDALRQCQRTIEALSKLVGRCDMAFELITTAQSLATAKRTARQLRTEIKKASEL